MINKDITIDFLNSKVNTNMTKEIGIQYTEIGDDFICGTMPVDKFTRQPYGVLHGGASVVLAESLGSIGSNMAVDQSKYYCVGQSINANHIRGVKEGKVYGRAECIHFGRKTHVWEIRINNEEGKLVCSSRLTVAVVEK